MKSENKQLTKHVGDLENELKENEEKIKKKEINKQKNMHDLQNSTKAFRESIGGLKNVFCQSLVDLKSDMASFSQEFDQKFNIGQKTLDNNNNKNVVDELRLKLNKLNEEIKNGPKNSLLSLLIEIKKVEQDAKAKQQKLEVCVYILWFVISVDKILFPLHSGEC